METLEDLVIELNSKFSNIGKFICSRDGIVNTTYIYLRKRFFVYELIRVHEYDGQWFVGEALHRQPDELQKTITDFFTNIEIKGD